MGVTPTRPLGPDMRRAVVVLPSAFTLGNLFFGFWSIVASARGDFRLAGWLIVLAGVLDMLDGRVARLSGAASRFGAELDSLVDVISFGVAPALLMWFLEFRQGGPFAWVLCWLYVTAVALRLARFNVAAAGKPSAWFTGMPSPSAGMTLAVWYPFSQTEWYQQSLAYLDLERQGLVVLMLTLSVLMVSRVRYPRWPRVGVRSAQGLAGLAVHLLILAGAVTAPSYFLFPLGLVYLGFGLVRTVLLSLAEANGGEPSAVGSPDDLGTDPQVTPFPRRRRVGGLDPERDA